MTKLTLSVDRSTIEKAKTYAKKTGRSLSELIQRHLETLIRENGDHEKISPRLKSIVGSVKLPEDFNEEKELRTYFEQKHM